MAIKIEVKKVVSRGSKKWKIVHIKMLKYSQLPIGYINGAVGESMWLIPKTEEEKERIALQNIHGAIDRNFMVSGDLYDLWEFTAKIDLVKLCGDRLQRMNKQLAEENKDWNGEEIFTI